VARNAAHINAPPERVFDVLADGRQYGDWVVGSRKVRETEPGFPAPGTKIHHQLGLFPLTLNDNTEVMESERPRLLVLQARGRPFFTARIRLELEPFVGGTQVTMVEEPGDRLTKLALGLVWDPAIRVRNAEALRRLKRIAERDRKAGHTTSPPAGSGAAQGASPG